jgi:hypothetical protein
MFFKAPPATLAVKRRLSQTSPAHRPTAPPSNPYANALAMDFCRQAGYPLNMPMHAPSTAGFKALLTDSPRKGVIDLPWRNAS